MLIDGIDVRQYHPSEVRTAVGIVAQAGDLFSGTVKENLLMARPDATDEEIIDGSAQGPASTNSFPAIPAATT